MPTTNLTFSRALSDKCIVPKRVYPPLRVIIQLNSPPIFVNSELTKQCI